MASWNPDPADHSHPAPALSRVMTETNNPAVLAGLFFCGG
jgi:hypothetical protein